MDVELQIDDVRSVDGSRAAVVVRCLRGPARIGARFHRIVGSGAPIDLRLAGIEFYRRPVEQLDPAHTALVDLVGSGTAELRTGDTARGWQTIQGSNPPASMPFQPSVRTG
ncbi:hypothetical protein [Actinoplanes sp. NPDC049681]|uniref:hypothetical protein n=1 Tax=Actinoplanes sp. NPDC049681 TaxID=3363905 RepID=UPI00378E1E83